MKTKVTLQRRAMGKDGRVRSMRFSYDNPSHLSAYPGKKTDHPAVAIRNIIIYCEIAHKDVPRKELAKRYATTLNSINSIYYKTAERFRRWRQDYEASLLRS